MSASQRVSWSFRRVLVAVVLSGLPMNMAVAEPEWLTAAKRGDWEVAATLLRPLAEHGDRDAQGMLGTMYYWGKGVPKLPLEAVKWERLAAEQGDVGSQYNLGHAYATGEGVPQDYVLAHMWYNLAASQMPGEEFRVWRDKAVQGRGVVELLMTRDQIAEAQRLAREWKPKRAAR